MSLVEQSLDASSRQVRIWAEGGQQYGWLIPGGTATIVIPPVRKVTEVDDGDGDSSDRSCARKTVRDAPVAATRPLRQ